MGPFRISLNLREGGKARRAEARLLGDYLAPMAKNIRLLGATIQSGFQHITTFQLWGV